MKPETLKLLNDLTRTVVEAQRLAAQVQALVGGEDEAGWPRDNEATHAAERICANLKAVTDDERAVRADGLVRAVVNVALKENL